MCARSATIWAARLAAAAVCRPLRRTRAGSFTLAQAVTMQQVLDFAAGQDPQQLLMPVDAVFVAHPPLIVTLGQAAKLKNGAQVKDWQFQPGTYRVYAEDGEFLLLGRVEGGVLTTIKSFFRGEHTWYMTAFWRWAFFDGIHLGHAALLDRTRQRAQALGLTPAALSFDTHPDTLVFGTAVPLLNTMAERELLMRRLCGMERVIFAHFDEAMMHMPWQVFVEDYLVRQLHAKHVVCGHDFHFGDRGQGDPARLQEKCRELGIGCDVIPEIRVDGSAVSSTRIRRLLQTGRCEEAVRLLGHGQLVTGCVTRGAGRGAGLGFPTANVPFAPGVLVPAFGVYRAGGGGGRRALSRLRQHRRPSDGRRASGAAAGGQSDRLCRKSLWKGACRLAAGPSARGDAV